MANAEARPPRIIAIDGPAGVGKSTAARVLAARLGLPQLDTGAMYRAIALAVLRRGIDPSDRDAATGAAAEAAIEIEVTPAGAKVRLDGEPVEPFIRTPEVAEATSLLSTFPEVRRRLVELQRRAGHRHGAVVEGRDIGTVVFPDTPHKFFLTARPEVRAARRLRDLQEAGRAATLEEVRRDQERRDARDAGRADSPLRHDDTYVVIDTSELSAEEVAERIAAHIAED